MVGVGGWLAACCAATVAVLAWRTLGTRMEAVTRACHELRGPLTAARLGLQLGARTGDLSADRLRALDLELGRAGLALDDLRAVGTRQRPTPAPAAVDIRELVSSSAEAWRGAAAARGCELRAVWLGPPAAVCGDRLRLAQATGNLIANAIEHGGGEIEVRGRCEAGAEVRVEVLDGGPGLPAALHELTRHARRGRGRRGRGLAIATTVARAHGGRLRAEASQRGARLVLELPALELPAPALPAPALPARELPAPDLPAPGGSRRGP